MSRQSSSVKLLVGKKKKKSGKIIPLPKKVFKILDVK